MALNACNQINGFELMHCTYAIITYHQAKLKPNELPRQLGSDRLINVIFRCLARCVMNVVALECLHVDQASRKNKTRFIKKNGNCSSHSAYSSYYQQVQMRWNKGLLKGACQVKTHFFLLSCVREICTWSDWHRSIFRHQPRDNAA